MADVIIESMLPPMGADLSEPFDDPNATGFDPEAPYGRNKDGTPSKKRGRAAGSTNVGGTSKRRTAVGLSEEALAQTIVEMSIPLAFFSPLASAVLDDRADRTAKALLTLAGNSPRFAKGLKTFASGSAYAELVMLPIGLLTAVMVDYGRMQPDAFLAKKYNIDQHYAQFMATSTRITNEPGQNGSGEYHQDQQVDSRSGLI